jgi:hypothetical protein
LQKNQYITFCTSNQNGYKNYKTYGKTITIVSIIIIDHCSRRKYHFSSQSFKFIIQLFFFNLICFSFFFVCDFNLLIEVVGQPIDKGDGVQ